MATLAIVPVSEYLSQTYEPDCDFVDGELEERNVGEEQHSELQGILAGVFRNMRLEWKVRSLPEVRIRVSANRYRIPDICLVPRSRPRQLKGSVISYAPILCVEILSPEDRMSRVQSKVNEYVRMGVQGVWVIDPWERIGYTASEKGFDQPSDGILRVVNTAISVSLAEIFAELDETEDD
jgi:Uma2 family endonuclease